MARLLSLLMVLLPLLATGSLPDAVPGRCGVWSAPTQLPGDVRLFRLASWGDKLCCPRLSLTPHSGGNGLAGLRGTVLWLLSACFNSASRGTTSRAPGPQPLRGSPQQPREAAHS